jgi:uncharacterized protein (TIGR02996 family)
MARSQADVFLEAILKNPDDDTPRLIYADWLDERGDPDSAARAEFIRIQCVLTGRRLPPLRQADLQKRERQLREQYGNEWVRPIRRFVYDWDFHRGFIDEVALEGGRFLSCAGRLFRRAPIRHLRLGRGLTFIAGPRFSLPALADSKHLRRLRSLDLSDNQLGSDEVRALVVSEHLTGLTALNLANNRIGVRGIRALAESPLLAQLTHLDLHNNHFGAPAVRALAEALERLARGPERPRLRSLDLRGNRLGNEGRRLINGSPFLRRVARPRLRT